MRFLNLVLCRLPWTLPLYFCEDISLNKFGWLYSHNYLFHWQYFFTSEIICKDFISRDIMNVIELFSKRCQICPGSLYHSPYASVRCADKNFNLGHNLNTARCFHISHVVSLWQDLSRSIIIFMPMEWNWGHPVFVLYMYLSVDKIGYVVCLCAGCFNLWSKISLRNLN